MASPDLWPSVSYEDWSKTCDTLHAHTQVLGKIAAKLAPPEPQLQHAALRLTARGWETAPLPAADGSGALVVALDLHTHEAVAEHSDGRARRLAADPAPRRRRGDPGAAGGGGRPGRHGRDRPDAAGGDLERPAGRGRRARDLRARPGRRLLRRRDPGRARAGCLPRALPRPLDAGQRLVGLLRPRRQPLLRPPRRAAVRRLHHAQRGGRSAGRGGLVAGRRPLRQGGVLRLRASGPRRLRGRPPSIRRRPAGTTGWGSTCSTGTTSAPLPIRTPTRSNSPARRSNTPASSAAGTRRSPRAPKGRRHRSFECHPRN